MAKVNIDKLIRENCSFYNFNMNDTFYYASADLSTIESCDFDDLIPLIEEHGYDTIVAYEALKRGHDPQIPQSITREFKKAKYDILAKLKKEDEYYLFSLRQDLDYRAKQK